MSLKYCTFTGVDENTNLSKLIEISKDFPFVEWGILYTDKIKNENRYPRVSFIKYFAERMTEANCNIALHVCGQSAAQNLASIINGNICTKSSVIDILTRELPIHLFQRIQINGNKKSLKYNLFSDKLKYNFPFNQTKFIFQTNHEGITEEEKECLFDTNVNIQFLVDESGGKGKELSLPDTYSDTNKEALMLFRNSGRFGYAGGIGYDNVNKVVNELENIVNAEYWIDMESNIRNESDQFDVSKCANVLEEVVLALNNK